MSDLGAAADTALWWGREEPGGERARVAVGERCEGAVWRKMAGEGGVPLGYSCSLLQVKTLAFWKAGASFSSLRT